MFYGQFLEDKYINELFSDKNNGICIDVGAYDGIEGSNSYFFEKKIGNAYVLNQFQIVLINVTV
jgi:hypothetical protein